MSVICSFLAPAPLLASWDTQIKRETVCMCVETELSCLFCWRRRRRFCRQLCHSSELPTHSQRLRSAKSRKKKKKERRGYAHKCMTEKTPLRLSVHTLISLSFTRLFRTATTATVARVAVLVLDLVVTVTKTAWTSPRRRRVRLSREGRRRHATSTATTALAFALTTHS